MKQVTLTTALVRRDDVPQQGAPPDRLAHLFKMLSKALYLRIIRELRKQPRFVIELAGELNAPKASVSNALKNLQRAGIVEPLARRRISTTVTGHCQLYALKATAASTVAALEEAAARLVA
jgi:predicted transcriptional regulator